MLVFLFLCKESVCCAQKSQPRGKFNFLEIWLFLPLHLPYFQNSLREVRSMQIGVQNAMMRLNLKLKVGRKSVVIETRLRLAGATHSNVGRTSDVRLD